MMVKVNRMTGKICLPGVAQRGAVFLFRIIHRQSFCRKNLDPRAGFVEIS